MCPLNAADLQRIFKQLDKNGDGRVSLEELRWLLDRVGVCLSLEELESFVGKSSLDLGEFFFFWKSVSDEQNSSSVDDHHHEEVNNWEIIVNCGGDDDGGIISDLAEAFNVFDLNGDGFISCEELQIVLSRLGLWDDQKMSGKGMICMYDSNSDGVLDFEEFKTMMLLHSTSFS